MFSRLLWNMVRSQAPHKQQQRAELQQATPYPRLRSSRISPEAEEDGVVVGGARRDAQQRVARERLTRQLVLQLLSGGHGGVGQRRGGILLPPKAPVLGGVVAVGWARPVVTHG